MPDYLKILYCYLNPIYNIISNNNNILQNNIYEMKDKIDILNNFRFMYYVLKYKKQFIKWYWKSQEEKIKNKYSPDNLLLLLNDNQLDELNTDKLNTDKLNSNDKLEEILNAW